MGLAVKTYTHFPDGGLGERAVLSRSPAVSAGQASRGPDHGVDLIHQTFRQLTAPGFLAPMIAAQGVFGLGRWGIARFLSGRASRPMTLLGANLGAFALEGLALVGSGHGLGKLLGGTSKGGNHFFKELGHAYLTMGLLRGWGGLAAIGRDLRLGNLATAVLSPADRLLAVALPQAACFGGIYTSYSLAPYLGLGEYLEPAERLLRSAVTSLHFLFADRLLQVVPGLPRFNRQINREAREYLERAFPRNAWFGWQPVPAGGGRVPVSGRLRSSPFDSSPMKVMMGDSGPAREAFAPTAEGGAGKVFLHPRGGLGATLRSFLGPNPSLKGRHQVPNLTEERVEELEEKFESGGRMVMVWEKPMLIELISGAMTAKGYWNINREDILFYRLWKNKFGFPEVSEAQTKENWDALQKKAEEMGIPIVNENQSDENIVYYGESFRVMRELLELLPVSMVKTPRLKGIRVLTEAQGDAKLSAFLGGEIYLYYGLFFGSRRNFIGLVLHELGHGSGDRYRAGSDGDSSIPEAVRTKMREAYRMIRQNESLIGLDFAGGTEYRKEYQGLYFNEFMADLHVTYVAAGPVLRHHIESLPRGSELREAWEFVYGEFKNRIFSGKEYDYPPTTETIEVAKRGPDWKGEDSFPFLKPPRQVARTSFYCQGSNYWLRPSQDFTELVLGRKQFLMTPQYRNISSNHLKISRFESFLFVQDLGSKNGTQLLQNDGKKIRLRSTDRKPSDPYPLLPGDRILLPGTEINIDFSHLN